jgi:hypothetical protein
VRFTDAEQELVQAAADEAGMSVANLLAETVLASLAGTGRLSVSERRALAGELGKIRRYLKAIGNNVNQLAAVANSTGRVPAEVGPTMHAVMSMVARLDALISRFMPGG